MSLNFETIKVSDILLKKNTVQDTQSTSNNLCLVKIQDTSSVEIANFNLTGNTLYYSAGIRMQQIKTIDITLLNATDNKSYFGVIYVSSSMITLTESEFSSNSGLRNGISPNVYDSASLNLYDSVGTFSKVTFS